MPELAAKVVNPSFLAIHPSRPLLYAVGEMNDTDALPALWADAALWADGHTSSDFVPEDD